MGALAMTAMMYVIAPMMGLHRDIAAMLGSRLGGSDNGMSVASTVGS